MENKLRYALLLSLLNFIIEVTAGILSSSLALLSDAVHLFTDISALVISLLAIKIGQRPADLLRTYGYRRFEILAAAANSLLLFLSSIFILYHGYHRLIHLQHVQSNTMLFVAIMSMILNLFSTAILSKSSKSSLNIQAAYNDSLADLISSFGVIIAALVIRNTGWNMIDPIIAIIIGLWLLPRCYRLLAASIHILLEGVPKDINVALLMKDLQMIPGIKDLHDIRVWSITTGVNNLTAHLVIDESHQAEAILQQAYNIANKHALAHINFQIESKSFKCKL